MRGRVGFVGLPAVELGREVDWRADPHRNRSWMLNLHALRWMGALVVAYEKSGDRGVLERAAGIAEQWVRGNPAGRAGVSPWAWAEHAVALRAPALVRLSAHVRADWLARSLAEHARVLCDRSLYRHGHNHGLDQDIALLMIGCRFRRRRWTELAIRRMTASAAYAIDDQGALHEQAPRYGIYVHKRLGVALEAIKGCGVGIPADLVRRRRSLEAYVSHATQPDGRLAPIGDSPADTRPAGFRADEANVKVFDAGYVFGRTRWNDRKSAYYSIRFGPGRKLHGHEDHLGVTYHAHGRDILVEAGFHSYEKTAYREWTASPEAHNVPIVVGGVFRPGVATRLEHADADRQTFQLADDAYGVVRTRSVRVSHGPDVMAVLDEVPGRARVRSLWHLAPSLRVVSNRDGRVVLADGDWRATMIMLPAGGAEVRPGIVSPGYLRKAETTTVLSAPARSVLTLIVPGTDNPEISVSDSVVTISGVSFPRGL
ncbi:heparinase II/III domain-containing protein [Acrocarpospora phusangensis]|nr:heparinase II/III family protein [Acrocarpospora phusangensis]